MSTPSRASSSTPPPRGDVGAASACCTIPVTARIRSCGQANTTSGMLSSSTIMPRLRSTRSASSCS
jgi:hypothetical protein